MCSHNCSNSSKHGQRKTSSIAYSERETKQISTRKPRGLRPQWLKQREKQQRFVDRRQFSAIIHHSQKHIEFENRGTLLLFRKFSFDKIKHFYDGNFRLLLLQFFHGNSMFFNNKMTFTKIWLFKTDSKLQLNKTHSNASSVWKKKSWWKHAIQKFQLLLKVIEIKIAFKIGRL